MDEKAFLNQFISDDVQSEKGLKRNNKKCVFPECKNDAIESHAISKESALRNIARNGKVLTFRPIIQNQIHVFKPDLIGVGEASTFRGFCKNHDDLFSRIDHGLFETEFDAALQLFRCIARWIFIEKEREKVLEKHNQLIRSEERDIVAFLEKGMGIKNEGDISYNDDVNKCPHNVYDSGLQETVEMYDDLALAIENDFMNLQNCPLVGITHFC